MKKLFIAVLLFVGIVSVATADVLVEATPQLIDDGGIVACTLEAKICPDGSAVGRVGPNCEFASCPSGEIVGGDKDEHGCIGSAGYIWNEEKEKCVRPWEEEESEEPALPSCPTFEVPNTCLESEILITIDAGECTILKCVDKKTHILENCKEWSDGCNICIKEEVEPFNTICTERFCGPAEAIGDIECLEYFAIEESEESLLDRIREADSEEERVEILKEEKEELSEEEEKENLIAEKSDEIFTKFDIIISKLKEIIQIIKSKSLLLEDAGVEVDEIKESLLSIDEKLELVEIKKAEAWILMQKTIELKDKSEARENLELVKSLLKELKDDITVIFVDIKDIIQDLKTILDE